MEFNLRRNATVYAERLMVQPGRMPDRILPGMMSGWMLPESMTAIINLHA